MIELEIYTDGSYDNQHNIGAWAAILFHNNEKTIISGIEANSTNNRMEITAVIKSIEFAVKTYPDLIKNTSIFSDSQYVINLPARQAKLESQNFITNKGKELHNTDLIKRFFQLASSYDIALVKVKAHQKQAETDNHNIEVDKLCRKLVREAVKAN